MFFIAELKQDGTIGVGDTSDNTVSYLTSKELTVYINRKGSQRVIGITESGTLRPFSLVSLCARNQYIGKKCTAMPESYGGITYDRRVTLAEEELEELLTWKGSHNNFYNWIVKNFEDDISEENIYRKSGYMLMLEVHRGDNNIYFDIMMD